MNKKYYILLFLFLLLLPLSNIKAIENNNSQTKSLHEQYKDKDFVIEGYDVNVKVNENNTFDVTETITAYFNVSRHGIYRNIPIRNDVIRLDGTSSKNKAIISNIEVNDKYTFSSDRNTATIKIGNPDKTIKGKKKYIIKYRYNIGLDPLSLKDELYINLIGIGWDTVIDNITFNITMPKNFDHSKIGFSSMGFGDVDNSNVSYSVDKNVIIGSYNDILASGSGLTVRIELPQGYFKSNYNIGLFNILVLILPIMFLIISFVLWYAFGRDKDVIESVEFYPPDGLNSLDLAYIYKGNANEKDVVSLLIYLANKGYIKITDIVEDALSFGKQSFKVTKIKDYDGNNELEKIFLNGLFLDHLEEKVTDNNVIEVTSDKLEGIFHITVEEILKKVNDEKNESKLFDVKAGAAMLITTVMIILTYIIMNAPIAHDYFDAATLIYISIPILGFILLLMILFYNNTTVSRKKLAIIGIIVISVPWFKEILPIILTDYLYMLDAIVGSVSIIGMGIILRFQSKRTDYGNSMLGRIKGFKNYLETADKFKLEKMVEENPQYFYDILPYAYVLGVSNKWIKKFEDIAIERPQWSDELWDDNRDHFDSFMDSTLDSFDHVMTSVPSTSGGFSDDSFGDSGGGSSGGGFSGGGSGGGGGGSW